MRRVLLALALGLAACAPASKGPTTNSTASAGAGSGAPRQICKEETVTGSNVPHTVCRTSEEADDEREAARTWHSAPHAAPPPASGGH